ncbi:MAG: nuclear transport factor 2 family protein [Gammaproteobacteria bacterium]|nr:nuclear transport factor 2 family protein [Gammaproteobacteria bacterium]
MKRERALGPLFAGLIVLAFAAPPHNAAGQDSLEDRLRAVEDHLAIEQLLMRYAAALNTDDADTYVSLFTPDATFELKRQADEPPFLGPFEGREALRKQWFPDAPVSSDPTAFGPMRHVTTNYEIDVEGDTATVRAFFIEVVSNGANTPPGSNPPTIHAMGRYEDELVKVDGRWYFAKRVVITDMNEAWQP